MLLMQAEVNPENVAALMLTINGAVNPAQAPRVPLVEKLATQAAVRPGAAVGGMADIWLLQKLLHAATEKLASWSAMILPNA